VQDEAVAVIAKNYLHYVAFAIPGLIYMLLYRFTSEGHSILRPIIVTGLFLLVVHAVLAFLLVGGFLFLAPMGGAGAGLATVISTYLSLIFMRILVIRSCPVLIDLQKHALPTIRFGSSSTLFKEGLPIGLAMVLQILALTMLVFFASSLGTHVVAAHQIMISIAMVMVMIPLALASASTIRVAAFHALADARNKRNVARLSFLMIIMYGIVVGVAMLLFGGELIRLFTLEPQVVFVAETLLFSMVLFQFFDAIQMVASGILRGMTQFIQPFLVVIFSYWVITVPLGYFVGVRQTQDISVVWAILALGIFIGTCILCGFVYKSLRIRAAIA